LKNYQHPKTRGGPGRGQGRKTNESKGMESKRIVIHVTDESEYNTIIKNTTPRSRTEVLIDEARKYNQSLQPTEYSR